MSTSTYANVDLQTIQNYNAIQKRCSMSRKEDWLVHLMGLSGLSHSFIMWKTHQLYTNALSNAKRIVIIIITIIIISIIFSYSYCISCLKL